MSQSEIRENLVEYAKQLKDWKTHPKKAVTILDKLMSGFSFDYKAVKSSKIHKILKDIKSLEEEDYEIPLKIIQKAKTLYSDWKNLAKDEKKFATTSNKSKEENSSEEEIDMRQQRNNKKEKEKEKPKEKEREREKSRPTENLIEESPPKQVQQQQQQQQQQVKKVAEKKPSLVGDFTQHREKTIDRIKKQFQRDKELQNLQNEINGCSIEIEEALYQKYPLDGKKYLQKVAELVVSLGDVKNTTLRKKLLNYTMTAEQLVNADPRDLIPEDEKNALLQKLESLGVNATIKEVAAKESFYKCEECNKQTVSYYSQQVRGADEPMTNFYNCTSCGHQWTDN